MIETAMSVGSVAVFNAGECLVYKETTQGNAHAEQIPVLIENCVKEVGIAFPDLKAVGVNKGPGSYTGLRIGTSLAKGLCYGLNIPLLALDSLKVMAGMALQQQPNAEEFVCMIDARRDEAFTATYDQALKLLTPLHAEILLPESFGEKLAKTVICGNCGEKFRRIVSDADRFLFFDELPTAKHCGTELERMFAGREFADVAYFEPDYGKAFMAGTSNKFKV